MSERTMGGGLSASRHQQRKYRSRDLFPLGVASMPERTMKLSSGIPLKPPPRSRCKCTVLSQCRVNGGRLRLSSNENETSRSILVV
jgi:hypothetical protein